jgi:hypothetical protein
MFGFNARKQKKGATLRARTINRVAKQAMRDARLQVGAGLIQTTLSGTPLVQAVGIDAFDVRITAVGSGGIYGWQAIQPDPASAGQWLDLDSKISGTTTKDPLYEFNNNAGLTINTRLWAIRVPATGELRGQYDTCTGSS